MQHLAISLHGGKDKSALAIIDIHVSICGAGPDLTDRPSFIEIAKNCCPSYLDLVYASFIIHSSVHFCSFPSLGSSM